MTAVLPGQAGMPVALPPRIPLAVLPTPLLPAPRLASALGIGELFIKRDDLTGIEVADVRGPGHGVPSAEGAAAAAQAVRTEGLMIDPVCTAKALSLLARHPAAGPVVFWHTGGMLDVVAAAQDVAR